MANVALVMVVLTLVGPAMAASDCGAGRTITGNLLDYMDTRHLALAINSAGEAVMASYDANGRDLVVTTCRGGPCQAVTKVVLEEAGDVGQYPAVAVQRAADGGAPVISFYDATRGALKVAVCHNLRCTTGATTTFIDGENSDLTGDVGRFTSIAVLPTTGLAVIAYVDVTYGRVKVAACTDLKCTASTRSRVGSSVGVDGAGTHTTSIAIAPASGLPIIVWQQAATGSNLRVAACVTESCTLSSVFELDTTVDVRFPSIVAQGKDGSTALLAFIDATTQTIRVASCLNENCAMAERVTVDENVDVNAAIGLSTLPDGRGLLAYFANNATNQAAAGSGTRLRLAVCSDLPCSEFTLVRDAESTEAPAPAPVDDADDERYEHHSWGRGGHRRRANTDKHVEPSPPFLHGRRLPHNSPTRSPSDSTFAPTFAPTARFGELVDHRSTKIAAFRYGPFFVAVQRSYKANTLGDLTAVVCANSLCECRAAAKEKEDDEEEPASGVAALVVVMLLLIGTVSYVASVTGHCDAFHEWRRRLSEEYAGRLDGESSAASGRGKVHAVG